MLRWDILDVDHHFIYRYIVWAADSQFELHGADKHLIDALVLPVELCLLVVDAVEYELEVGNVGEVRVEVREEADVEDVRAAGHTLLEDGLDLLEQAVLLDFLVVEEVLEQLLVVPLQKLTQRQPDTTLLLLKAVVLVQVFVKHDLVLEVGREENVLLLQLAHNLFAEERVAPGVLEQLGDEEVEDLVRIVEVLCFKYLLPGFAGHSVARQPVPLEPHRFHELAQHSLIMQVLHVFRVQRVLPLIGLDFAPNASIKTLLALLFVEVGTHVGQHFWEFVQQGDEVILQGDDELLKELGVDEPVDELEGFESHADGACVVAQLGVQPVEFPQQEGLDVQIFVQVVLLHVDFELPALSGVALLRVEEGGAAAVGQDFLEQFEFLEQEVRADEILEILFGAGGALDLLLVDLMAAFLDFQDFPQVHRLLLQLLLDLALDGPVVPGRQNVLVVQVRAPARPVPNLEVDFLLAQAHFQSHVVFLLYQLGIDLPEA